MAPENSVMGSAGADDTDVLFAVLVATAAAEPLVAVAVFVVLEVVVAEDAVVLPEAGALWAT